MCHMGQGKQSGQRQRRITRQARVLVAPVLQRVTDIPNLADPKSPPMLQGKYKRIGWEPLPNLLQTALLQWGAHSPEQGHKLKCSCSRQAERLASFGEYCKSSDAELLLWQTEQAVLHQKQFPLWAVHFRYHQPQNQGKEGNGSSQPQRLVGSGYSKRGQTNSFRAPIPCQEPLPGPPCNPLPQHKEPALCAPFGSKKGRPRRRPLKAADLHLGHSDKASCQVLQRQQTPRRPRDKPLCNPKRLITSPGIISLGISEAHLLRLTGIKCLPSPRAV
ncbi:hypothetical protein Anapl_08189 [Anas platyrhynchos]|uniref:Uncharacterized protein n=1 Tax=Anas platyrhynchos TaxID=8839 RepID=R0LT03_ANAPL|nr:hypothetical protein Anapl_08189 [Anas platyrhynchos]